MENCVTLFIGKNLQKARRKSQLTQLEVAEVLGICRSNISKYESGDLEPSLQMFRLMCMIYRVSADDILKIK